MVKKFSTHMLTKVPIYDVSSTQLNTIISDHLKQNNILEPIQDYDLIKTGMGKELAPEDSDWYYKRASSIFRAIVINSLANVCIGTHYFSRKYCTRKNRGVRPSKFVKGATGHVKAILEDFVKKGWVKNGESFGYCASEEGLDAMKAFIEKIKN